MPKKFQIGGEFAAGGGLLSDVSKRLAAESDFKVSLLPLDKLVPNPGNAGFSMDEIEELKTSIREVGLEQNLVVVPIAGSAAAAQNPSLLPGQDPSQPRCEGAAPDVPPPSSPEYKILTGHRRYQALRELAAEGYDRYALVPCVVKDLAAIDLPLSDEMKEVYALITTNIENRRNTPGDIQRFIELAAAVYDELRAQNYPALGKRRDFIAGRLGLSPTQIQRYAQIVNHLSRDFQALFAAGRLALTVAEEISRLAPAAQAALFRSTPDPAGLSVEEARAFAEKRGREPSATAPDPAPDGQTYVIDKAPFQELKKSFDAAVKALPAAGSAVDKRAYDRIMAARAVIEKQLAVIKELL